MAYEFHAHRDGVVDALSVERLAQQLADGGRYEIEPVNEREITIRFAQGERRSSWPEDASLYLEDDRILVAVHSGTETQRSELVQRVTDIYRQSGVDLTFLEE